MTLLETVIRAEPAAGGSGFVARRAVTGQGVLERPRAGLERAGRSARP